MSFDVGELQNGTNRRVLVQLTEIKDHRKHGKYLAKMRSLTKPADIIEIEVIDNHNLKCNFSRMPGYQMFFDCIGLKDENCLDSEFTRLASDLLVNLLDASLIRFSCLRELDMLFLHKIFVHELENFFKSLNIKLQNIYFEYHDLRKHDIINMIQQGTKRFDAPKTPHRYRLNDLEKEAAGYNFSSTKELFMWLNKKFTSIWSRGVGHDLFEMEIELIDNKSKDPYKVKFSLIQVYLAKMDLNDKINLCTFLQNCNQPKTKKYYSTMLIDLMKEHIRNKNEQLFFMFDIPIFKGGVTIVKDMLTMAEDTHLSLRYSLLQNNIDENQTNKANNINTYPMFLSPNTNIDETVGGQLKRMPDKNKIRSKNFVLNSEELSLQDLNMLSYWYTQIEESYANVISAMELFYAEAYKIKALKMRNEIEYLFQETEASLQSSSSNNLTPTDQGSYVFDSFIEYQKAVNNFRDLFTEATKSKFASNLKIFLRTKNYELLRQFTRFKEVQLENYHGNLIQTISDLVGSLKYSNATLLDSNTFDVKNNEQHPNEAHTEFPCIDTQ